MLAYHFDFRFIFSNYGLLVAGLKATLALTFLSCIGGTLIAIPLAMALRNHNWLLRLSSTVVVEIGKGVPLLVLVVAVFYLSPSLIGWTGSAFWSAVVAFTLNLGCFLSDIFRGGVNAIPRGHIEAAESLGLTRTMVLRRVVIPETFRRTLPALSAFYIGTLKLSTIAALIGVPELLFNGQLINAESPHPLEIYAAIAVIFLLLVLPISTVSRHIEKYPWVALAPQNGR